MAGQKRGLSPAIKRAFRRLAMQYHPDRNAEDGAEALSYLFGTGQYAGRDINNIPTVVLLDLKLPGVDGFEVLRQIKSTPILKRLPVIILTSSKEEADRALSYDIGTNSYLVKPLSFDGFLEVIRQIHGYWLTLNVAPPENNQ